MNKANRSMARLKAKYNRLKNKVNPYIKEGFKYGGTSGKSRIMLNQQIRTMEEKIKAIKKYGYDVDTTFYHNYLKAIKYGIQNAKTEQARMNLTDEYNYVRRLGADKFNRIYNMIDEGMIPAYVIFDISEYYTEEINDDFVEKSTWRMGTLMDYYKQLG